MGRICLPRSKHNQIIPQTKTGGAIKRRLPEIEDCRMRKRTKDDDNASEDKCPKQELRQKSSDAKCDREVSNRVHKDVSTPTTPFDLSVPSSSALHEDVRNSGSDFDDVAVAQHSAWDVQLSQKALRVLNLKRRFADTIFKAEHNTLFSHSAKVDPEKLQREKEQLARTHVAEKAWIEKQLEAAEEASRISKTQKLQQDREAARIALDKMKRTIFDSITAENEFLEMISGV